MLRKVRATKINEHQWIAAYYLGSGEMIICYKDNKLEVFDSEEKALFCAKEAANSAYIMWENYKELKETNYGIKSKKS